MIRTFTLCGLPCKVRKLNMKTETSRKDHLNSQPIPSSLPDNLLICMTADPEQTLHDISHLLKVRSWASLIADREGLEDEDRLVLESAAVLHDIACPSLRSRNGKALGPDQEKEGLRLAAEMLSSFELPEEARQRILFLVSHHHTFQDVSGADHQILLEADFLVNADEGGCSKAAIQRMYDRFFRTGTGKMLLEALYLQDLSAGAEVPTFRPQD